MRDLEKQKEWRKKNRKYLTEYARKWRNSKKGKEVNTNTFLKRKYKITLDDKKEMYKNQNGLCAVCRLPLPDVMDRGCQVDHCHSTNKVRSLLHWYCNMAVGIVENNKVSLQDIEQYLKSCDSPNIQE
jgi:hypothetical protein